MKYFTVFSGVEGFGQGFPADWEAVGFSEIDRFASMVLKYHYPTVKNYGDISNIDWRQVPDFDLLAGGSPCQDFSIAGKRKGLGGARSSLAWEYIRCLRDKQPRYFIWENVKGVMSSRSGWDFANILTAFSESGYDLWWQVLNAKDFGVAQNRERIFIVGSREGSPKEVFFEPKDSGKIEIMGTTIGDENTRRGDRDAVFNINGLGGALKATDYKQPMQILQVNNPAHSNSRVYAKDGLSPTFNTMQGGQRQPKIAISANTKKGYEYAEEGDSINLSVPNSKTRRGRVGKSVAQTLDTGMQQYVIAKPVLTPNRLEKRQNGRRMKEDGEPSFTLNTQDQQGVYDGVSVRRLMPIECERLMGWTDDWTKYGTDEKGNTIEISDSQRYKMCGNGVVSPVITALIEALELSPF